MNRPSDLLPKNPYFRGFQWVFTLFLQVLNEWIFTATHRSLFGLSHPIFLPPCISPDGNCTDLHYDICEKIHNNRVVLDFYLNL